jgi:hypothetical protein
MRLLRSRKQDFLKLPKKEQRKLLLKAAKFANAEQKRLENKYLRLQTQQK